MINRSEEQKRLEEADKRLGLESLYYFAKFNLGYSLMEDFPHKAICSEGQAAMAPDGRLIDLEPRGVFKTTIFSQALPTLAIIKNPNIRILLDSGVLQNSIDNLGVIQRHFEGQKIKFLYGDYTSPKWNSEEMIVGKRTRSDLKEPTVRVSSPERMQTGPHYDLIIGDDLVSPDNIATSEQRQKIKDHIALYWSLLDPGGAIIIVGTRWHDDDAYGLILKKYPEFRRRVKNAETSGPNKTLYFPQRLSASFLAERRSHMTRDLYNSQYKNDPAPEDENSKFQRSWFKRYKDKPEGCLTFVTVDPGGEHKGNDEWVFLLSHVSPENQFYFEKCIHRTMRQSEAWDILFDWFTTHNFLTVGIESTAGQKFLKEPLENEMRRRNIFFNVAWLPHAGDSKGDRIMGLEPRYRSGSIYHSEEMAEADGLEDQLIRFPKGADDIADAAASVPEVAVIPRKKKSKITQINSVDDLFWKAVKEGDKAPHQHSVLGTSL